MKRRLAILGSGRLGEALAGGLLRAGWTSADHVVCVDVDRARLDDLGSRLGVRTTTDAAAAVVGADVVILAVKPQTLGDLLDAVGAAVPPTATVVSVAAGITAAFIEERLDPGMPVVRVMPNTPILVGEAMSALAPGRHAAEAHLQLAESVFGCVGRVLRLGEADLDAVTAVSGSGPAYVFLLAEAMADAGVRLGLDASVATELATQTLLGAATLLRADGRGAAELRAMVTSPGGTTQAALEVLEDGGFRALLAEAIAAAARRSAELAAG